MIVQTDLNDLPEDRELAFVLLENKIRVRLQSNSPQESASAVAASYIEYINDVLTAAQACELSILTQWERRAIQQSIFDTFPQFLIEVNSEIGAIKIRHALRSQQYSVALEPATKERIRYYLSRIKAVIDRLEISPAKREALYARVNALSAEVDRDRTRFESVSALLIEAACAAGNVAIKLEPVRRLVVSIARVIGSAQESETNLSRLPTPPASQKQLEGPRRVRKLTRVRRGKENANAGRAEEASTFESEEGPSAVSDDDASSTDEE